MKQLMIKAAKEAGKILMENLNKKGKEQFKSAKDIATETDIKSEKKIIEIIKQKFPEHSILTEEAGKFEKKSDYEWIIDPLDGTVNYAAGNPCFCVSIALAYKGKVIMGVVYDPFRNELFFAEKNKGALLNNKRIQVSKREKLIESVVGIASMESLEEYGSILRNLFKKCRTVRITGSCALSAAYVAAGRLDARVSLANYPWDYSAGCLIVEEAGGECLDFNGNPWKIHSRNIVHGNHLLVKQLLGVVKDETNNPK